VAPTRSGPVECARHCGGATGMEPGPALRQQVRASARTLSRIAHRWHGREVFGGGVEVFKDISELKVPCEPRVLSVGKVASAGASPRGPRRLSCAGDMMWIARSQANPTVELVLNCIVERKRWSDMVASIKASLPSLVQPARLSRQTNAPPGWSLVRTTGTAARFGPNARRVHHRGPTGTQRR
jgi:hypothetical protein